MKRTVIIQIKESKVFFNDSTILELAMTNLPANHFQLTGRTIYWELIMEKYDSDLKILDVVVADYDSKKYDAWKLQTSKKKVERLHFIHVDWPKFENCLSYYDGELKKLLPYDPNYLNIKPLPKPVMLIHKVAVRNLKIGVGYVTYSKKVRWSKTPITFMIRHVDMIPQLEYVKPYFAKILRKKTIDVQVTLWKEEGEMIIGKVSSADLKKINRESLYVIKGFQIDNFIKKQKSKFQDSVLLTDEALEDVESDFGNIDSFEKEILFHLLEKDDVRNKLQLQYLSEKIDDNLRLMISLEPQFGFLFTIVGDEMVHVIWELIDTHATYVWSFEQQNWDQSIVKILEEEFSVITQHGRSHYRNFFEARTGIYFHVVNHKTNQNPMVDYFGEWRLGVERLLV